jgi:hypothetical protein
MSKKCQLKRLAALLALLVTLLVVHGGLPIAAADEAIPTVSVGPQVYVDAAGPFPAADNATPLLVVAQLMLDQAPQPPFSIGPVPLNLEGSGIIPASTISLPTSSDCSLTNDDTMLVCQITPSGTTWGTSDGFVVFNVRLTATSGHVQISSPVVVRIQLTSIGVGNNTVGQNNSTGIGVGKINFNFGDD